MITVCTLTEADIRNRDTIADKLIARMACGDMNAMGELYQLIETDVYAYALSKTANKEDAEDITHDTFVQIWKSAPQYKAMGKPLAWIFTIEINLIRKRFNDRKKFVSLDEAIGTEPSEDSFTENVINNEFLRQLLRALNEEEREIITLHVVSNLKHREIAKLLNKPLSTVLSKYNRAIKKLQIQITEKEDDR